LLRSYYSVKPDTECIKDNKILANWQQSLNISRPLPGSLWEAVELTRNSKVVREALGEHVFNAFLENKKIEWDKYRTWVTDYEKNNYLPLL